MDYIRFYARCLYAVLIIIYCTSTVAIAQTPSTEIYPQIKHTQYPWGSLLNTGQVEILFSDNNKPTIMEYYEKEPFVCGDAVVFGRNHPKNTMHIPGNKLRYQTIIVNHKSETILQDKMPAQCFDGHFVLLHDFRDLKEHEDEKIFIIDVRRPRKIHFEYTVRNQHNRDIYFDIYQNQFFYAEYKSDKQTEERTSQELIQSIVQIQFSEKKKKTITLPELMVIGYQPCRFENSIEKYCNYIQGGFVGDKTDDLILTGVASGSIYQINKQTLALFVHIPREGEEKELVRWPPNAISIKEWPYFFDLPTFPMITILKDGSMVSLRKKEGRIGLFIRQPQNVDAQKPFQSVITHDWQITSASVPEREGLLPSFCLTKDKILVSFEPRANGTPIAMFDASGDCVQISEEDMKKVFYYSLKP